MEEELTRLRSQVEVHKMEATVIAQLEGERAALERERETLRSMVETLKVAARKVREERRKNAYFVYFSWSI